LSSHRKKLADVLKVIRRLVEQGRYDFVAHARQRLEQRQVTLPEVVHVLRHGFHEQKKDQFKEEFSEWVYAIRGKTLDDRKLRIAAAINDDGVLVITVIDLDK
jgi:hypothetical protein